MREPPSRLPAGPDESRRILDECETMLARPNISPEMKEGLKQRIAQLRADIQADAARRARDAQLDDDEPEASSRPPRR